MIGLGGGVFSIPVLILDVELKLSSILISLLELNFLLCLYWLIEAKLGDCNVD